jgi:hypothetical protein
MHSQVYSCKNSLEMLLLLTCLMQSIIFSDNLLLIKIEKVLIIDTVAFLMNIFTLATPR